jgi:hypothetical protein
MLWMVVVAWEVSSLEKLWLLQGKRLKDFHGSPAPIEYVIISNKKMGKLYGTLDNF